MFCKKKQESYSLFTETESFKRIGTGIVEFFTYPPSCRTLKVLRLQLDSFAETPSSNNK